LESRWEEGNWKTFSAKTAAEEPFDGNMRIFFLYDAKAQAGGSLGVMCCGYRWHNKGTKILFYGQLHLKI